jgi:hypothetical protein
MLCVGYADYGDTAIFICNNLLSNPKIHHDYEAVHPEEFPRKNLT